jgi:quercetin dioxygenase-like cupin family protein
VLNCPRAGKGTFDCSAGTLESSGRRSYQFADRVEAQPTLTRAYLLDQLAKAEQSHQIDHAAAERIQRNIADSGDDFFAALSGAITVSTIGGAEQAPGRPGFILVPPAGVPAWISCVAHGSAFRCRNLASSSGVAVGTPIYFLPSSPDWVAVPGKPGMKTTNIERYFREALGRNLRPAEQRLLIVLLTAGSGSGQTGTSPPQPTPR